VAGSANQQVQADAYRGQRVRFSGWVRTRDAAWVISWVRVDGAPGDTLMVLALSNGADHPITGSVEWQRVDRVVDVAPTARAIAFGVMLRGGGTVWLDDFTLEPVDRATPSTDVLTEPVASREAPDTQRQLRASWQTFPPRPRNLDFEEPAAPGHP
jgi:hypothetical protein